MTFARLAPDSTDAIIDFVKCHGDPFARRRVEDGDPARLFDGRSIYGSHRNGRLSAVVMVAERTHLTWRGRIHFPFVTIPDPTPERKRAVLADFLVTWRAEQSPHWRRMVIYDETPDGAEAPFLGREGFAVARRHMKYALDLAGDPPLAETFPRVAEALARGYSVSMPTVADIEADPGLADTLITLRNTTFALRDNADQWTPAEMLRQIKLPGALMMVLWHKATPVGLTVIFVIEEGDDKGEAYVSEIVVHRRHWGKVAADLLGFEMLRTTHALGARRIAGIADETNRPSRNLMERFGLTPRGVSVSWAVDLPPSASR